MRIAYYDEAGDDGYPNYFSAMFVLSALYMPYLAWKENFEALHEFRRELKRQFGLPVRTQLHSRKFVLNKNPYKSFGLSDADRLGIVDLYCERLATLELKVINVCIDKTRIRKASYPVLLWALKFSVQRIENDLRNTGSEDSRFLIITDPGRVGKMRKTTRKVRRINYIPSMYGPHAYRRQIERLIEDPLPKDSRESYFIQSADLVSHLVYLHAHFSKGVGSIHARMPADVTPTRVTGWLDELIPCLNTEASRADRYGIYYHPT